MFISSNSIIKLDKGYNFNYPFPFTYIDNFLNDKVLIPIKDEIKNLKNENGVEGVEKFTNILDTNQYNKFTFINFNNSKNLNNLFEELCSDVFISHLEKCTGITDLIRNDTTLFGAGVHRITKGGILGIHTDFNIFQSSKYGIIDRRINLLIYLNENWREEYKGDLLLCDKSTKKICYKIMPILNRCVIFNTTKMSLHGHPEPLTSRSPTDLPGGHINKNIIWYMFLLSYYAVNKILFCIVF
jgi:Rps23 Pro-64 3,4-dihydroxylase Tpa1-like proline 4-hydroxylase